MRFRRSLSCVVFVVMSLSCVALGEEPTTAPAPSDTLDHGAIAYASPGTDWKMLGKRKDDLSVGYGLEGKGEIVLVATPQKQNVPNALGPKLAEQFAAAIKAEADKGNIQIIEPPKAEKDPRFLLKMHDKFKSQEKTVDRLQLFKGVGKNLISVTVRSFTDDAADTKKLFETGEQVMVGVRLPRPGATPAVPTTMNLPQGEHKISTATTKPVLYPEAKLRVSPPAEWKAESTGKPSGLIVSWRDPNDQTNLILLNYRPIPADAKKEPALRDMAIEQTAAGEQPSFQVEGGQAGPTQTIPDKRFLRKTHTDYDVKGTKVRVSFRQVRAGDGVASVTSVSLVESADDMDALADKIATEVRSAR